MSATHYVHEMYLLSMQWFKRTDPGFIFGVLMIRREQRDHSTDCYFCMISVKGLTLYNILSLFWNSNPGVILFPSFACFKSKLLQQQPEQIFHRLVIQFIVMLYNIYHFLKLAPRGLGSPPAPPNRSLHPTGEAGPITLHQTGADYDLTI